MRPASPSLSRPRLLRSRPGTGLALCIGLSLGRVGCAARRPVVETPPGAPPPQSIEMEPMEIAVAGSDRLITHFPDSRYVAASLYNAGLAAEGKKDYHGAIDRYRKLIERYGSPLTHTDGGRLPPRDILDALFRMGACLAEVGNWP